MIMILTLGVVFVVAALVAAAQIWRWRDGREADRAWRSLARRSAEPRQFAPLMVEQLPDPARRFFLFTIEEGAVLRTVSEIRMRGALGLGTKEAPNYAPMHAEQILAPPHGLVWKLRAGRGMARITGSDGCEDDASWVKFWLAGTVPIVRAGGTADHARAAFGRVVAESVFWCPAALLPHNGVAWEAVSASTARATVTRGGLTQTVDVTIAESGQPSTVVIPRWTDANADKVYRLQPFGGYLSAFEHFDGYVLPTHVEGGNFIGTADYFPFYKADVDALRFL